MIDFQAVDYDPFAAQGTMRALEPVEHNPFAGMTQLAMAGKLPGMDVAAMPEAPGESLGGGAGPVPPRMGLEPVEHDPFQVTPSGGGISSERLTDLIVNQGKSFAQAAQELGVSRSAVSSKAFRMGIKSGRLQVEAATEEGLAAKKANLLPGGYDPAWHYTEDVQNLDIPPKVNLDWGRLRDLVNQGGSVRSIARDMGVDRGVIYRNLQDLELTTRNAQVGGALKTTPSGGGTGIWSPDMDRQLQALVKQGLSTRQIGNQLNVSDSTVRRRLGDMGVRTNPLTETRTTMRTQPGLPQLNLPPAASEFTDKELEALDRLLGGQQ